MMLIQGKDVFVVFEDNTSLWWLKFLKKGFRHCKMYIKITKKIYLEVNPLSNQMFLFVHIFEKESEFKKVIHRKVHIQTKIKDAPLKTAPFGVFTCVEAIKRAVGIHKFSIITPYQLYRYILSCRKKVLTR